MQKEVDQLKQQNQKLSTSRNELKDELLLSKQLIDEHETKIEEVSNGYEIEIDRLLDQNERKEYILQLCEQRLVDLEKFLRDMGKDDPHIRQHLQILKVNPDFKRKKITSVVQENSNLKNELKNAYDHIESLESQLQSLQLNNMTQERSSTAYDAPFEYRPSDTLDFQTPTIIQPSKLIDKSSEITMKKPYDKNYHDGS